MKLVLTFFCFLLLVCPGFAKDKPPNVLFIAVDDLNDWVACLGGHPQARTPNIDRLAARGVLFEQAYCSAPLCNPSRMATMTGLRSSTIGIWSNEGRYGRTGTFSWFRDKPEFKDWVTIPQYFRQHGYTAVAGGKIFHKPHGKFSDPVSWDHQYSTRHGTPFPGNGRLLHGMSDKMAHEYYKDWADWQPLDIPERETADWKTAEGAAAFLRRDHDKPFFLACGIFRPHLRWYAPRKYFDMHPLEKIKLPATLENDLADVPPGGRRQNSGGSQAFGVIKEHGEWKKAVQGYLAACSFADACVGVVLDALKESDYAENTIVVLWGDHGFHVGEKDRISKLTLWEQGSKTPLIISAPDLAATRGKRCKRPVSLVDLYPTLVELCGLPARDGLDGRSIAPLVRKPETEWEYPAVISRGGDHAVRSQRWHYIRYADGGEELYDAARDPHQWKNLARDTRFTDAKTKLRKWLPGNKAERSGSIATGSKAGQKSRQSREPKVAAASTANNSRKRPNVVTLLVDDLGYRDIGCYGGPVKTPVLDKLAAEGVRFTDFHSGAPVCSPSRATFLTGRNHIRAGVYSVLSEQRHRMHLLRSETTLAEVLKDAGYGTAHFGKWHLGMPVNNRDNPTPAEHGFDYWFGLVNGAHPSHKDPTNFLRNGKPVGPMKGYSCQLVVDEAIDWLDKKRDADAPFFINLWFNEPHAVIAAPDEIVSRYGALNDQAAIYNGTIDNTDRAIGRLVAKLEQLGELDNTIIHYSSDNGSYRQDRCGKLRGKKGSHHEGGHRVPGIFYWRGKIPGGRIEKEPAGAVDLLPTICGLLGIDKPKDVFLDGSDLTPLLTRTGSFERHQPLFWMNGSTMAMRMGDHTLLAPSTARLPFDNAKANRLLQQTKLALGDDLEKELGGLDLRSRMFNGRFANREANRLRDEFRAMFYFNEALIPLMKKGGVDRVQLYDLSKDLGQQNDIAKERPELVARMKKQAAAIHRSVMADAPEWLTPKEQAAAKKPRGNRPQRPATGAPETDTAKLLARIDKNDLPEGYHGSRHQAYVDRVMAGLKPEQRARVGELWKEKRRLDPDMPNPGASFVRILTHVAGDSDRKAQSSRHFVQLKGIKPGAKTRIHGRVTDAKGGAMAGVMVTAYDEEQQIHVSVFTAADGKFEMEGLRKTTHQVRMRRPGQLDEWVDDVKPGSGALAVKMEPARGEDLQMQRTAASAMSLLKWDSLRDKENFKMMCTYCHQAGTVGFRTPEQPVDWETMVRRMDGFGGLYKHTQRTIVKRLIDTYTRDAESRWPEYLPPPHPTGFAAKVRISEWDIGIRLKAMVHDLEPGPPGTMYAVDMGQNAIVELDIATGRRTVFRMPSGARGPHSIEPDNDGNYWVTLCSSGHMGKFDPRTTDITVWSSAETPAKRGSYPHTLRIDPKDPEGLVWYTDAGRNSVFSIHPKTGHVKEYHLLKKNQAVAAGKGESRGLTPYGLDVAPDGSIWYSKLNANRIGRIDPKAPDGDIKEWNPPFRGPRRHHVDQDGIVWVPGFGSGVLGRFDPKAEKWTTYALPDYENQIPYALNIDARGIVWICGTGNDTIGRFDPKTERLIEIPMPTRVTFTREIEFDEEGNVWTCSSNGPTRHNERGRGSLIRIELPKGEPAADEGVKLKRIVLPHHQVAYVRPVAWHKSPHGELLKKIDAMPAPEGIPVNKTLDKHFKKRMASFTDKQRRRFNTLRQGMDLVDPDMENRGLSYLKILEYIHNNEKLKK